MFKYRVSIVAFAMVFGLVIQASAQNQARRRIINYNLEWYYFGDLVTFVAEGGGACPTSATTCEDKLVDALLKMCDNEKTKADLVKILRGEKDEKSGETLLFKVIRNLDCIKQRSEYKWEKLLKMNLKICYNANQVYVGPNMIILPWPFRNGGNLMTCSGYGGDYENLDSLFQISHCMLAVEDLLTKGDDLEKKYRKDFIKSTDHKKSRQIILDYTKEKGHGTPIALPSKFRVHIEQMVPLNGTAIESDGNITKLHVGVQGIEGPGILFEKWPCGAF